MLRPEEAERLAAISKRWSAWPHWTDAEGASALGWSRDDIAWLLTLVARLAGEEPS